MFDKYIPAVAKMDTELKKYRVGYAQLERKNKSLEKQNERLTEQLEEEQHESILKKMEDMRLRRDYDAAVAFSFLLKETRKNLKCFPVFPIYQSK